MAQKRRFADLIQSELVADLQTPNITDSVNLEVPKQTEVDMPLARQLRAPTIKPQSLELTDSDSLELPKYQTLDRKEARLRADQIEALNLVTKGLNRGRRGKGERLTDNTLIRVAIDLLLSRADELQGVTEEELRQSLGLMN